MVSELICEQVCLTNSDQQSLIFNNKVLRISLG